jgi:hypothetical protein
MTGRERYNRGVIRAAILALLFVSIGMSAATLQPRETYAQKIRSFHSVEEFGRLTQGRVRIVRDVNQQQLASIHAAGVQLPVAEATVLVAEPNAIVWIGTQRGAVRLNRDDRSRQYFAGLRWLPDDHVTGIGIDGASIWIETSRGYSRVQYAPMTLADKSRAFVERVQARHNRWGLTADSRLRVAGDLSSNQLGSTDNDGLWTAMYVAAESFRFKVTGAADARDHARVGMQAIMRLESITGIPGFPARSFIKVGVDEQPADGEWHDTRDGWRWKGDTSSDEIVGHYFVYPIYYDLVADTEERRLLSATLGRITDHILAHNYQLIDVDGQRTRWGWWAPDLIWNDADETGLRALHILAHLRVAIHLAGDSASRARYQAAYDSLVTTHRYHLLTRNQKIMVPGSINHSDDELAFLSYYPLLQFEKDPALLAVYKQSLERSWRIERPERNPLWNLIYAAGTGAAEFDRADTLRTLQEIPMDTIQWTVANSHRLDVPVDTSADRQGRRQALVVLPYDELPMSKWNGNPYNLDGGNGGRTEDDGAYFLLPYWMGRYHGLIGE